MALTKDTHREFMLDGSDRIRTVKLAAGMVVFEGAILQEFSSGYCGAGTFDAILPTAPTCGLAGIAIERADSRGQNDGAVQVRVRSKGIVRMQVTGASMRSDASLDVYALDDGTLVTADTWDGTTGIYFGRILEWIVGTWCWVQYAGRRDAS